jgi:hypothetical protein
VPYAEGYVPSALGRSRWHASERGEVWHVTHEQRVPRLGSPARRGQWRRISGLSGEGISDCPCSVREQPPTPANSMLGVSLSRHCASALADTLQTRTLSHRRPPPPLTREISSVCKLRSQ